MLPEDDEELFTNDDGETWNRILVIDYKTRNELMRLRSLDHEFKEYLISVLGEVFFQYHGGNMDGVVLA